MLGKKPDWLKKRIKVDNNSISEIRKLIGRSNLNTVCQSAKCPNIFECYSRKTATFMLMGDRCTRNCGFCGVDSGKPFPLNKEEPVKIAEAVERMGLRYVVLTSVTRDDLTDGGARHFAAAIKEIKKKNEDCCIECLIPDLKGNIKDLEAILSEDITVLNHNLETIPENYARIRPEASYPSSLNILKNAKTIKENIYTKTGFMLGLGENWAQIKKLLEDIRYTGCDMVTIGQYLRPSANNTEVVKYYSPQEFKEVGNLAKEMGLKAAVSGIFVRSSYHASELLDRIRKDK